MHSKTRGSVTVRLKGGLGNQLFQYASGKALARQLDAEFFIDTGWFLKPGSNRNFKLPEIGITAETDNHSKIRRSVNQLAGRIVPGSPVAPVIYLNEPEDHAYHELRCDPARKIYMDGYWQSERYFSGIRQQLLDEIDLSRIAASHEAVPLPSDQTVAVHVRRGDYISQAGTQALSREYVVRAMSEFGNNYDFMFFSDDISWCKENFTGDNLSFSNNQSDLQDLKQMSEAAHNIIANSTFSWWGAWLNGNEGQRVIAPQPWTHENTHRDIIPENWEALHLSS